MKTTLRLVLLLLLCLGSRYANAQTALYVDSATVSSGTGGNWALAYKTLGEALNVANAGTGAYTIYIAKGTYYPTGAASGTDRESTYALLRGNIKLYGGYASGGMGARNITAYPVVLSGNINNASLATDNSYHIMVIANIGAADDSLVIDGISFRDGCADGTGFKTYNTQSFEQSMGAAVHLRGVRNNSKVTFRNCSFINNTARLGGGAIIANISSSFATSDCVFSSNRVTNTGGWGGGAIMIANGSTLTNVRTVFYDNNCVTNGGAIYFYAGSMLFQYSCLLINNYATAKGGAYYVDNGSYAEMANNTLYSNAAINSDGGAIYSEGDMVIDNTIFYRNAMYSGGSIPSYTAGSDIANMGSSMFLSNSSLQFNPALAVNYTGYTDPGNSWVSNIYPQFLDSANKRGADNTWATADDGLSLLPSSNMINAGLNAAVTGAAAQGDLAGAARIQLGTVDMGAYESAVALSCPVGNTVYVDSSVAASGSGGTWTGAFKTLQEAMAVADRCTDITHILIAKGTYFPTPDNNRDSAIVIRRSNIKIYGGYPKGGGSRNIAANPTIIDGNIGGGNYSYHLVVIAGIYTATDSIILDGLTLRNAKADGGNVFRTYNGETLERMYGGGIYLRNVRNGNKTVFRNCTFSNNLATNGGGAIMNNVYSSVWITSCQFIGNTNNNASSIYGGGAIFSASNSIAAINSSIFTANRSATAGGAIFQNDTSLSVINCTFSGDTAAAGGAISLINQSPFYSRNNLFRNNVATGGHGGAIYANHTGTDTLVNNVFTGNKCTGNSNYGGGAAALIGGSSYVVHNTFYADSANGYSGALLLSGVSAVYNNIFYKCYNSSSATPDIHSSGTHTAGNNSFSNTNPVFYNETNLPGADNIWFTSDDGLRLKNNSPAINTGDNSKIPANITTDITGSARIQHIAEPGAYEGYVCMGNGVAYVDSSVSASGDGTSWAKAYRTLAEVMDATRYCSSIDTILIAKGTYYPTGPQAATNRDTTFRITRKLKIYGGFSNGGGVRNITAHPTKLDGNIGNANDSLDNSYHILTINGDIAATDSVVIEGLTIQNGQANTNGGGVYLVSNGSGPKVAFRDVRFVNNTATGSGGAIYEENVAPLFVNCVFEHNKSASSLGTAGGGAVFNKNATPVYINSQFINNTAFTAGGAIRNMTSTITLNHCKFSGNRATNGGAIYNTGNTHLSIDKGVFSTNIATAAGGVIHQDTGTVTLNQSRFTSNTANTGGVLFLTGTARLKGNAAVFHENYSAADGGVLRLNNLADDTVYNSLFIHNRAGGDGASIYTMQANKYFGSNTFYGDTATGSTRATAFVNADNVVVNSIFYKTSHEISGTYAGGFNSDNNTNPLFINETNPAGADRIPGTVDDGLRILNNSPVKDAGTNAYVPAGNTTDITGRQRIRNGVVDCGAYEGAVYAQHVLYVDQYKSGNGSSWGNALRYLSDAFSLANQYNNIDSILVASGSYYPTGNVLGSNRDTAFALFRGGIKILGGYPAGGGLRNPSANESVMDGRIFGASDYSLHILVLAGITAIEDSILIDGFVIQNGGAWHAGGSTTSYNGQSVSMLDAAGVSFLSVANGARTTLSNCTIRNCFANNKGGGIYMYQSSPAIINCNMTGDSSYARGGAVYCENSNPLFSHTTINNCYSPNGGAFFNYISSPTIRSCMISNNRASIGGGMSNDGNSFPVIDSSLFSGNTVTLWGGAISNWIVSVGTQAPATVVTNSRFTGNKAGRQGGAVYNSAPMEKASTPSFRNCIFTGNIAGVGGALFNNASSVPVLEHNTFIANSADSGGAVSNELSVRPVLINCRFINNKATKHGGAMYGTGPDLINCNFSGNKAGIQGGAIAHNGTLTSRACTFEADSAGRGGALYGFWGSRSISNSVFLRNVSTNGGGGALYVDREYQYAYDTLVNNVFYQNKDISTTNSYGGALYLTSGIYHLLNNTFYGDSAANGGGAIYATYAYSNRATLHLHNNLFYKNGGSGLPDTAGIGVITHSNNSFGTTDPSFANEADPTGPDMLWATADDGLQVTYTSTTLNTGDNTKVAAVATDIKGSNRIQQTTVDIGAYEGPFDACNAFRRLYVHAAAPASLGGSWAFPMNNLNKALALANACSNINEIWVAAGTYKPSEYPVGHDNSSGARKWSFGLVSGVKLLGGFNGTETDASSRSLIDNPTILSGNIGDTLVNTDNCYHVVVSANDNDQTSLDGFIIEDGYAADMNSAGIDGQYLPTNAGGGMAMLNTQTKVVNCIFRNNSSRFASRSNYGDAIYITSANNAIDNCIFHNDASASSAGGAVYSASGNVRLNNCVFHNNQVAISGTGTFTATNCTFTGQTQNITAINGTSHLYNSIIWNNAAALFSNNAPATVSNSIVQGGSYTSNGNSSVDPKFTDITWPMGADGKWFTADDGLQLQRCSPAINQGQTSANSMLLDIAGHSRVFNTTIDIGAYEYQALPDAPALAQNNDSASRELYPGINGLTTEDCRVIAQVLPNGSSPVAGSVFARAMLDSSIQQYSGINYVQRHYDITPASNAATATARLTLFFTQAEFNTFNLVNTVKLPAHPSDVTGKEKLRIWQQHGTSATGTPGSYSGTDTLLNPDDAAIVWNGTDNRWEVSFNVTGFSGFFVTAASSVPLPVQLISFEAVKGPDNKSSVLEWQVNREAGMSRYKIQRSSNGNTFETIGSVAANGKERYQFMDEQPLPGINFYRLSMVEVDGSYKYSRVIRIMFEENSQPGIVIYPNPAATILNINPDGIAAGLLALQYTDLAGRTARTIRVNYIPGEVIHDDISTLPAGSYILTLPGTHIPPVKLTVLK